MPLMTIKTVWFGDGKTGKITFEEAPDTKVTVWANSLFKDKLVVGAKADAKFDTMPAKGDFPESKVLVSWDGMAASDRKPGGGGGGARLTPEQFLLEKRSILASVALKEAREFEPSRPDATHGEVLSTADAFYAWLTKKVGLWVTSKAGSDRQITRGE